MSAVAIAILGSIAASGVLTLWLGCRGKRVNDHPVCRKCRFDLSGVDLKASEAKCPECGTDITGEKAIRRGMRVKRRGLLGLGGCLAGIPALILLGVVAAPMAGLDINKFKPTGLLLWEGQHANQQTSAAAAKELLKRSNTNELDERDHRVIADAVLKLQAQTTQTMPDDWAKLFNSLPGMSQERLDRFTGQILVPKLIARPLSRHSGPLVLAIDAEQIRGAGMYAGLELLIRNVKVEGMPSEALGRDSGSDAKIIGRAVVSYMPRTGEPPNLMRPVVFCVRLPEGVDASEVSVDLEVGIRAEPARSNVVEETPPQPIWTRLRYENARISPAESTVSADPDGDPEPIRSSYSLELKLRPETPNVPPIIANSASAIFQADQTEHLVSHAAVVVWPSGAEAFLGFVSGGTITQMLPDERARDAAARVVPESMQYPVVVLAASSQGGAAMFLNLANRDETPRLVLRPQPWLAEMTIDQESYLDQEIDLGPVKMSTAPE